jgi:hypothetical protein
MTYTLGNIINFSTFFTAPVGVKNTGPIGGWRAFARRKDGKYHEVLQTYQEDGWVDGTNEGFWGTSTWDTREEALKAAQSAYRRLAR